MSARSFYMAEPAYPDYGRQLITDLIVLVGFEITMTKNNPASPFKMADVVL